MTTLQGRPMRAWVSACRHFLALCLAAFGMVATHAGEVAVGIEQIHVSIKADLAPDGGILVVLGRHRPTASRWHVAAR